MLKMSRNDQLKYMLWLSKNVNNYKGLIKNLTFELPIQ